MNKKNDARSSSCSSHGSLDEPATPSAEISAVICVKNAVDTIEQLFLSLERTHLKEIVIVDGMSNDGTIDICRKYTDKIISDDGKGLAYARQLGAEEASSEIIAYVDADVEIRSPDIFQILLDEMRDNGWVAINPQILDPRKKKNIWEEAQDLYYQDVFNHRGEKRYLVGMVLLVGRDIVQRFPFDPVFTFGSEDADFFHRVGKKGKKFGVSSQTVFHFHRSSFKNFARQKIGYGVGDLNFIMKHCAFKNLTTPVYIFLTGVIRSVRVRKPSHILFYMFWAMFLEIGMLKGFFMYCKNSVYNKRS
jgi:glycosyltransferase involved in cell wall biosynthesis